MLFFPNAKINIGLNITSKREDGYHHLETIFYPIQWKDVLEILPSKDFSFSCSGIPINTSDNLCLRAYNLLKDSYSLPNIKIHLHKNIPMGAGLGGGSSDAAFTLMGLNQLFNLGLNSNTLKSFALQLGADCPFFIDNTPSLASGIGEVLRPIDLNLSNYHLLVVKPSVFVSTAEAFSKVVPHQPKQSLREKIKFPLQKWTLKNDFEQSIFPQFSELEHIKNQLLEAGALYASMSGSGSSLYGLFSEKPNIDFPNSVLFHQVL